MLNAELPGGNVQKIFTDDPPRIDLRIAAQVGSPRPKWLPSAREQAFGGPDVIGTAG